MKAWLVSVGVAMLLCTGFAAESAAMAVPGCKYYSPYACKAKRERACGKVRTFSEGVQIMSRVFARGASCKLARKIVRTSGRFLPRGWKVMYGSGEGAVYAKGRRKANGARLPWKRYVRYTNVMRRSLAGSPAEYSPGLRRLCGNNPRWVWVSRIRTRGVSCKVAYRITMRYGKAGHHCWSKGVCRIQGFRCRESGSYIGWSSHRCKRGRKLIWFQIGG